MHPNPLFRSRERSSNLAYARERGFGVLTMGGVDGAVLGPLAAHVPFVLRHDPSGGVVDAHLSRANPIVQGLERAAAPVPALLIVSGPDGYVSPDGYGPHAEGQVPTWNYVAVHLRGHLELRPASELHAHLSDLAAHHEAFLAPKPPWSLDRLSAERVEGLAKAILPVRLRISAVDGTWKLGQNKAAAARVLAADAMREAPWGQEVAQLAAWMADPPGS